MSNIFFQQDSPKIYKHNTLINVILIIAIFFLKWLSGKKLLDIGLYLQKGNFLEILMPNF